MGIRAAWGYLTNNGAGPVLRPVCHALRDQAGASVIAGFRSPDEDDPDGMLGPTIFVGALRYGAYGTDPFDRGWEHDLRLSSKWFARIALDGPG